MPVYSNGNRTVEARQFVGQVIPGLVRDEQGFYVRDGKRVHRVEVGDYVLLHNGDPRSAQTSRAFLSEYRRVDPVS